MKASTIFKSSILTLALLLFAGIASVQANEDWAEDWEPSGYSGSEKVATKTAPVASKPETANTSKKNNDYYAPLIRKAQFRKTIAVARFENRTTAAGQINLGSGMADQLTNALVQSDNFVVLERASIADVLYEQDFARSGRARKSKVAKTGRVVPAQIMIKGAITEFDLSESGGGVGVSYNGFSLGGESATAHVGLVLRIIDTTSGEVIDSVRIEGKSTGTGYKLGVMYKGLGFDAEKFENTALSKSVQIVINRAVQMIADNLNRIPFEGKIIKVNGDSLYTNIGSRNNVFGGDMFDVYDPGTELVDPDTGESLGSLKKKVGTIVVSSPEEKYSKAFASNGQAIEKGFILIERKKKVSAQLEKETHPLKLANK
jgi:curli biogenesis system outer membrane secretion channel CsgG